MTVIEFKKREFTSNAIISCLIAFISVSFIGAVFLYTTVASLRQDIAKTDAELERAQVQNAELKNDLYSYLDANTQESFLQSRGLVTDKHPTYVQSSHTAPVVATQQP